MPNSPERYWPRNSREDKWLHNTRTQEIPILVVYKKYGCNKNGFNNPTQALSVLRKSLNHELLAPNITFFCMNNLLPRLKRRNTWKLLTILE